MVDKNVGIIIGIVVFLLIILFVWPGYNYFLNYIKQGYNWIKSLISGVPSGVGGVG